MTVQAATESDLQREEYQFEVGVEDNLEWPVPQFQKLRTTTPCD